MFTITVPGFMLLFCFITYHGSIRFSLASAEAPKTHGQNNTGAVKMMADKKLVKLRVLLCISSPIYHYCLNMSESGTLGALKQV